jgi:hypothetical protein
VTEGESDDEQYVGLIAQVVFDVTTYARPTNVHASAPKLCAGSQWYSQYRSAHVLHTTRLGTSFDLTTQDRWHQISTLEVLCGEYWRHGRSSSSKCCS